MMTYLRATGLSPVEKPKTFFDDRLLFQDVFSLPVMK